MDTRSSSCSHINVVTLTRTVNHEFFKVLFDVTMACSCASSVGTWRRWLSGRNYTRFHPFRTGIKFVLPILIYTAPSADKTRNPAYTRFLSSLHLDRFETGHSAASPVADCCPSSKTLLFSRSKVSLPLLSPASGTSTEISAGVADGSTVG